ncbi:MAG: S16 family serine protease, partial [Arenicellales bacterium]
GLKEKLLAAHRGGIATVLIPKENEKDLVEIPGNIKSGLEIISVRWIDEVIAVALESLPDITVAGEEGVPVSAEVEESPTKTPARAH